MTFCIGIKVARGLVGLSDTRVTSGVEYSSAPKTTVIQRENHSMFIMTSGLRSAHDKALTYFNEVLESEDKYFTRLYTAVNEFADQVRRVRGEDLKALKDGGYSFDLTCIIGGQLEEDKEHKLYMLYPEGNWVEASEDSPFYIIGESAFGKPILRRVLTYKSSLKEALKLSFLAFDSTRVAANDVDYPIDIVYYKKNSYSLVESRFRAEELRPISSWWQNVLKRGVSRMPSEWIRTITD
ncbi:MAG TPA: peptidase [Dehalococcoidia bacterium]|nr:peptidase [Dehalococcoidia bacterium]